MISVKKPIKYTALAAALLLCAGCEIGNSFLVDGHARYYNFHVPASLPDTPVPLVILLHGAGSSPEYMQAALTEYSWDRIAEREKFIVVYPESFGGSWNDCRADEGETAAEIQDVAFLDRLITRFGNYYNIDENRVYVAGHSNGGMMAFRLALEIPERIAAVASNCGPMAAVSECGLPDTPVSVFYMAGTADPVIPYDGGAITGFGEGNFGTVLSADGTVYGWVENLNADETYEELAIEDRTESDGCTVTRFDFRNGDNGTEVVFYQVNGGGHTWPYPKPISAELQGELGNKNQDIDAAEEMWAFFKDHPK
jgi:polyhydroxybutyrate depolymerase